MISAIYAINSKGDIVLYRKYRDDVTRNAAENFRLDIIADKNNDLAPITEHNGCFYFHIRVNDMFLVAATKQKIEELEKKKKNGRGRVDPMLLLLLLCTKTFLLLIFRIVFRIRN